MQQSLFASLWNAPEPDLTVTETISFNDTDLADAIFTVIDCETTGLNAKRNSLTEITAIQYRNNVEIGKFSTLIKPAEMISEEVEAITGISNDMVQNAPPLITVLGELSTFVGQAPIIVGHNVGFDIKFITEKLEQSGLQTYLNRFDMGRAFCTKALAVKALPGLPSYEGLIVAAQVGVVNPNPHRAESDVRMSAGILFGLIERLQAQMPDIKTVYDLQTYQGSLN